MEGEWRGCPLCKKRIDCTELSLKKSYEQVESLQIKIRGQATQENLMAGARNLPPNQDDPVNEAFLLQLQEALHSQALTQLQDFCHLDTCWKSSTAGCKQLRRLLGGHPG